MSATEPTGVARPAPVRNRVSSRATAAIVLTGAPDAAIEDEARRLGACCIVEPIEPAALLKIVREALAGERPEIAIA
jgi:hypothetical protein